ncbi:hypothetical protein [Paucimonas lemoignei]|uniref:hypothetical protein n=1 Tax=Paucimonas lemoignei TaxID=29443 RepID=UPI001048F316|nr:hypothetical protein [Paucimonas lemoignei]
MNSQLQAIGIAWYRESDYDALRAMFTDGHKLPSTFLQWQDQAEQARKRYVRQGHIVIKAHIDPVTFPAWCDANGCTVDAQGRMRFASAEAHRIAMEANKNG